MEASDLDPFLSSGWKVVLMSLSKVAGWARMTKLKVAVEMRGGKGSSEKLEDEKE